MAESSWFPAGEQHAHLGLGGSLLGVLALSALALGRPATRGVGVGHRR